MVYQIDRQFNNQKIIIPIRTDAPTRIIVKAYRQASTVYFEASPIIAGMDAVIVKIPKMPPMVRIDVYNAANGNLNFDRSLNVGQIKIEPINMSQSLTKILDPSVAAFAKFCDAFAERAGYTHAGNAIFRSPDGKFQIDYMDVIRSDDGKELRTPCRINSKTGIIQVAKKYFSRYTVPGRKFWLWHEYSHLYRPNKVKGMPLDQEEMAADKNAIMIYLMMGNPTVEAYNVIFKVFKNTPSDLNRARYNELNKFIRDFSSKINNKPQLKKAA